MNKQIALLALIGALATPALANNSDLEALQLADKAPQTPPKPSDWRLFVEGALGAFDMRSNHSQVATERFSAGLNYDHQLSPNWRAVIADRIDTSWHDKFAGRDSINTWQESYLSWQPHAQDIFDFGRINVRNGVAVGYNPTDYFGAGAIRSFVSLDPNSLKDNRLGSVMLRGQRVWTHGSFTALYSPKLSNTPNGDPLSPDFGATNNENRWLLAFSQRITHSFSPQWLLYDSGKHKPQLGMNLTALLNNSTVVFFEWSFGLSRPQVSQALDQPDHTRNYNRASTGFTYTTATKLSITLEYEYDGAALSKGDWKTLRATAPMSASYYLLWARNQRQLPTRKAWFAYATWRDLYINDLDITALLRLIPADHSHLTWVEARYHLTHFDFALQWEIYDGQALTTYGSAMQKQTWRALATYYF